MSEDDRRLGAYAPPPDDYETFDARDADQDRRGWLFLAAAAVVFALFVAVVYNTFQLGVRERSDSPVIAADAEPFRVAAEAGETGEGDLGVHNLRSGERREDGAEPAPARAVSEEPVDLPQARVETADADALAAGSDTTASDTAVSDAPAPDTARSPARSQPEPAQPSRSEPVGADPAPSQPAASQPSIEEVIAERERDRAQSGREPSAPAPEPTPTGEPAPQPFLAQIAAFRSRADAEADWVRFSRAFPDLAAGKSADIQFADLGDRGTYHRLRINGFSSRQAANEFCESLQARGQACIVARR